MKTPIPLTVLRWLRFNSVGAIGALVQLASLALFAHLAPAHPLLDTTAALELTLLHNFVWHRLFTWRSTSPEGWLTPFLRFHLSNGIVSLGGNLLVMQLLVNYAHLAPLPSNAVAIAICSSGNFWLSNAWAFAPLHEAPTFRYRPCFRLSPHCNHRR